jgi:hypothetical protein
MGTHIYRSRSASKLAMWALPALGAVGTVVALTQFPLPVSGVYVAFLLLILLAAYRLQATGIEVQGDRVTIRNFLRRTTVPVQEVRAVEASPYPRGARVVLTDGTVIYATGLQRRNPTLLGAGTDVNDLVKTLNARLRGAGPRET